MGGRARCLSCGTVALYMFLQSAFSLFQRVFLRSAEEPDSRLSNCAAYHSVCPCARLRRPYMRLSLGSPLPFFVNLCLSMDSFLMSIPALLFIPSLVR